MLHLNKAIIFGVGMLAAVGCATAQTDSFSSGTGFFINDKGVIVTNAHVIKGCQTISVKSRDLGVYTASIITTDVKNDIAVLQLEKFDKKSTFPALNYRARLGESSYVFGYPLTGMLSDTGNFTTGSVSSLQGIGNDSSKLQISTPVQPGNSGGPVLDDKGNLIGIVVGKLDALKNIAATKDIAQNVNFAIKSQILDGVLQAININATSTVSTQIKNSVDIADLAQIISVHIICKLRQEIKSTEKQNHNEPNKSYPSTPNNGQKARPVMLGAFGEWGAFATDTPGKGRVCYILAKPKERLPKDINRNDGFLFITARPADSVHNEISFVLGFPTQNNSTGEMVIGSTKFTLVTKGTSAWVKNAAEDNNAVELMKNNNVMYTKMASNTGITTVDRYILAGINQALNKVRNECP